MTTVADVIRERRAGILDEWTTEATRAASSRGLTQPEIANIMPQFLDSLVALRPRGELTPETRRTIEGHVRSRLHQGFSVPEIVEEFALLGRCITRASSHTGAPPPSPEDLERLFETMHAASLLVTDLYAHQMLDDEQTEKLALRRMRAIAAKDIRQGHSIAEQLRGVVDVAADAMRASSVVVAVYDVEDKVLIDAASAGASGDRLRAFVLPRDAAFLASPTLHHLDEAFTDVLIAKPDELGARDLKAVLGVRVIAAHVGLLGSIYIGIDEDRPFAARELSRLEALGAWLALHLDNAHLFEELGHKVEQLEEERQLRDRFVSILAHDLRGPLAAAKLLANMLRRGGHSADKLDELSRRIEKNVDRSDRMVRDLLDANRVHAGQRLTLIVSKCSLNDIVRDVAEELTNQYGGRFVLDVDRDVIGFWSPEHVRRALWNLGVNAAKYGSADTPITIRLHRTPGGVRLAVHNFGKAIPAAELPSLFRTFARTRAAEASSNQGWGLGLVLVSGCAEAHGGTVSVASEASTGTEFVMDLPADSRPYQPRTPEEALVH